MRSPFRPRSARCSCAKATAQQGRRIDPHAPDPLRSSRCFNADFDALAHFYSRVVRGFVRHTVLALLAYAGLVALTIFTFTRVPVGFIPLQDMGYFLVVIQLPDALVLRAHG